VWLMSGSTFYSVLVFFLNFICPHWDSLQILRLMTKSGFQPHFVKPKTKGFTNHKESKNSEKNWCQAQKNVWLKS